MLTYNAEFVENTEYAYAVARIRALETRFIDEMTLNTLLSSDGERFVSTFCEVTGIKRSDTRGDAVDVTGMLDDLEESFSETHRLVGSLILEERMRRFIGLRYDYELLKFVVKEEKGEVMGIPLSLIERSNYGHGLLKSLLAEGRALQTGETLYKTYRTLLDSREASSAQIDIHCDRAYYDELFQLLGEQGNPFIRDYVIREIDSINIATVLRLKLQGDKRSVMRERYIPRGSIDLAYLEEGFDMNLEGFAGRIQFSPFAQYLREIDKNAHEEEQVAQVERRLDAAQTAYLKESLIVSFGIEPLLAYLWIKERELNNLRTIFIAKMSGISQDEIRTSLRGPYG
jgi:V/A-type H+-transporting ATPase subunit C